MSAPPRAAVRTLTPCSDDLCSARTGLAGCAKDEDMTIDCVVHSSMMSRATFARVFQQALGQAPMKYLSDWRMALARDLLLIQDVALAEIAGRVGYSSVYAFATAFRRHHGESPGRWRQREALRTLAPASGARRIHHHFRGLRNRKLPPGRILLEYSSGNDPARPAPDAARWPRDRSPAAAPGGGGRAGHRTAAGRRLQPERGRYTERREHMALDRQRPRTSGPGHREHRSAKVAHQWRHVRRPDHRTCRCRRDRGIITGAAGNPA